MKNENNSNWGVFWDFFLATLIIGFTVLLIIWLLFAPEFLELKHNHQCQLTTTT